MKRDILCISNLDWDSAWQRHQEFMSFLTGAGYRVFYLNNSGFTSPQLRNLPSIFKRLISNKSHFQNPRPTGLSVIQPKVIPPRIWFNRYLNNFIFFPKLFDTIKGLGIGPNPILFTYIPSRLTLTAIDFFSPTKVIYDYVSDFAAHPRPPRDFQEIQATLLDKSDLILTDSNELAERLPKTRHHPFVIHHGVSEVFFLPPKPKTSGRLRGTYFGTIDSKILDFRLLKQLADRGHEIELIGPVKGDLSELDSRVLLRQQLNQAALVEAIRQSDILLLPYQKKLFNSTVTPAKIYQCLATGKPIVVQGLQALQGLAKLGLLKIATDNVDFIRIVESSDKEELAESHEMRQSYAAQYKSERSKSVLLGQIERLFV